MKEKSGKAIKLMISIFLIIGVLCCSFSVFAVDETPQPVIGENRVDLDIEMACYYVYLCLKSWGINITYQEILDYSDYVKDQLIEWFIEYLANSPSNYSISQWIAPWQAGYDYWGNLKFNSSLLEDVQDFANWLKNKLGLSDNQTVVINPVYNLEGISVYDTYTWYQVEWQDGSTAWLNAGAWEYNQANTGILPRYFFSWNNGGSWRLVFFDLTHKTGNIGIYRTNDFVTIQQYVGGGINTEQITVGQYTSDYYYDTNLYSPLRPVGCVPFNGNYNQLASFLSQAELQTSGDLKVLTTEIDFPADNPDYTSGDGMIIVDGNPSYEAIVFSGEVTNLPAIVSTNTIENPHMEEAYRPVQGLLEMTRDGVELVHSIVNELPVEAVTCAYALIGAIIVFGMIKLMREH